MFGGNPTFGQKAPSMPGTGLTFPSAQPTQGGGLFGNTTGAPSSGSFDNICLPTVVLTDWKSKNPMQQCVKVVVTPANKCHHGSPSSLLNEPHNFSTQVSSLAFNPSSNLNCSSNNRSSNQQPQVSRSPKRLPSLNLAEASSWALQRQPLLQMCPFSDLSMFPSCSSFSSAVNRASLKQIAKVTEDSEALKKMTMQLERTVNKNKALNRKLREDVARGIQDSEVVQRLAIDPRRGFPADNSLAFEYFKNMVDRFQQQSESLTALILGPNFSDGHMSTVQTQTHNRTRSQTHNETETQSRSQTDDETETHSRPRRSRRCDGGDAMEARINGRAYPDSAVGRCRHRYRWPSLLPIETKPTMAKVTDATRTDQISYESQYVRSFTLNDPYNISAVKTSMSKIGDSYNIKWISAKISTSGLEKLHWK
ncbi:unnamed protein product [Nesidiocoris tenuis]|uniref:Uncharacterized protein n=1 Tax=Nesidiocoris tenuis TaxID=355587 RepID=A0A6H5FW22_9HEMI|nr:unnamed protein product [Nesidiocoris tenuis]